MKAIIDGGKNMKGKILVGALLISSSVIFSCGLEDDNSPQACSFEVEQALDKGNYDYVIQTLEQDITCKGAYSIEEGKIQLAAAYVGKAGFDIPTLIEDIITADSDENADNYTLFVQAIAKRATGDSLNYLRKAKELYKEIYGNVDCGDENVLKNAPDIVKDACFYSGLTDTAKATTSVALLIGADANDTQELIQLVQEWATSESQTTDTNPNQCKENDINNNGIPDSADASACALEYSTKVSSGDVSLGDPYTCDTGLKIEGLKDVVFLKPNYTFHNTKIVVYKSNNCTNITTSTYTFERLIYNISATNTPLYATAITQGYCKPDRTECENIDFNDDCYPCPVVSEVKTEEGTVEEQPISTAEAIIETINEGADAIVSVVPTDTVGEQTNVEEAVIEFKKDLCSYEPTACKCDKNGDGIADEECQTEIDVQTATDVEIKLPSEDPNVQNLIANYLQKN